jgi:hypothetical protein
MKNRGCFLPLLLLTLAGNANTVSAQTSALQVQVYDYTGLSPAAFHAFVARTQEILAGSGVSLEVDACASGAAACESHSGISRQIVLRVIADTSKSMKNVHPETLGQSVADQDGGTYATLFLRPAEEKAHDANLPRIVVLAYAAAHEIGHLLLGEAHSPQGLMKAAWSANDFLAMSQKDLHFSPEQASKLTSHYGAPRQVYVDANTELAVSD